MGEDVSRQIRRGSAAILVDCKEQRPGMAGKQTGQTAFSGCECRFQGQGPWEIPTARMV